MTLQISIPPIPPYPAGGYEIKTISMAEFQFRRALFHYGRQDKSGGIETDSDMHPKRLYSAEGMAESQHHAQRIVGRLRHTSQGKLK